MATDAGKPTLHEIAAMSYPMSERAMRQHYDPLWGKHKPQGECRTYSVEVRYTYRGSDTWTTEVDACSEDEARELAEAEFDKADLDLPWDVEVDDADFEVSEARNPRQRHSPTGGDTTQIVAPFMSGATPKGGRP